jgi:hypothetical protein
MGDIIKIEQLEVGNELVFSSSIRSIKNKKVNIGTYHSGRMNLVSQIVFLEKV